MLSAGNEGVEQQPGRAAYSMTRQPVDVAVSPSVPSQGYTSRGATYYEGRSPPSLNRPEPTILDPLE